MTGDRNDAAQDAAQESLWLCGTQTVTLPWQLPPVSVWAAKKMV